MSSISSDLYEETLKPNKSHTNRIIQIALCKTAFRQVIDLLRDECKRNNFQFISNDNITRDGLWRYGLHLNSDVTYMFARNLVDFLKEFIFSKSI